MWGSDACVTQRGPDGANLNAPISVITRGAAAVRVVAYYIMHDVILSQGQSGPVHVQALCS